MIAWVQYFVRPSSHYQDMSIVHTTAKHCTSVQRTLVQPMHRVHVRNDYTRIEISLKIIVSFKDVSTEPTLAVIRRLALPCAKGLTRDIPSQLDEVLPAI